MSKPNFQCGFDEAGNPALFEVDSAGNRIKVVTLFSNGIVIFQPPYDSYPEQFKNDMAKEVGKCPTKK